MSSEQGTPARVQGPDRTVQVSLVVPMHRDVDRVGATLTRIGRFLRTTGWRSEVVVLDDGSDDGTPEAVTRWAPYIDNLVVARHARTRGLGAAARSGVLLARGAIIVLVEPRLELPLADVTVLQECIEGGAEVAVISRRLPGAEVEENKSFLDRASQTTFSAISRLMVPLEVRDSACEMIAFSRMSARRIAQRAKVDGDAFGHEWLALAQALGMQVVEIPASWLEQPTGMRTRPNELGMLRDLWQIRRRLDKGGYAKPRAAHELLHETRIVKFDRELLFATRSAQSQP